MAPVDYAKFLRSDRQTTGNTGCFKYLARNCDEHPPDGQRFLVSRRVSPRNRGSPLKHISQVLEAEAVIQDDGSIKAQTIESEWTGLVVPTTAVLEGVFQGIDQEPATG